MNMKGVLLAGGKGTRLGSLTRVTNKHLLPVAYQPMIFYPLNKLIEVGVTDIMVVSGTEHMGAFLELLGSGKEFGCSLTYRVQDEAGGIAQALGLAADFCRSSTAIVILGDNIFQDSLTDFIALADRFPHDAWIMLKRVEDPQRYGVAEMRHRLGEETKLQYIHEKPCNPPSNLAVTGIYAYPPDVYDIIKTLRPSHRGELEITDVNNYYLKDGRLRYLEMHGFWTDAGTLESLALATQLVNEHAVKISDR